MTRPTVGVVVLAFREEPLLGEVVDAVHSSTGVAVDLVVVDNGYTGGDRAELQRRSLRWWWAGSNTGYALGSNLGAQRVAGEYLAFLNSDAVVAPDALAHMIAALDEPAVGIATAQVLLYDEPGVINSAGNPVHYSLLSWAGGWGDPADRHAEPADPASASGCLLVVRRSVFEELDGFSAALFAYGEDVEFSLRARQAGYRVRYVPQARVWHRYSHSSTAEKLYLLERNRWVNLLTLYEAGSLLRLLPGLALVEAGIWATALRGGWLSAKVRGVSWVVRHRGEIRRRRRRVQAQRRLRDARILPSLDLRIEPSPRAGLHVPAVVNGALAWLGRVGGAGPRPPSHAGRARQPDPAATPQAPRSGT